MVVVSYACFFSLRVMQIHIKKLDGQKEEFSLEPSDSVMKVSTAAQACSR